MGGKWKSFDESVTTPEFLAIPQPDQRALKYAMERFGKGQELGWIVKNYGNDLFMLKASNGTSGRCLFFTVSTSDPATFVALLFYKKESQDSPSRIVETARRRKAVYEARE